MVRVPVKASTTGAKKEARKLISFKIDSILPDTQSLPNSPRLLGGELNWPLRFSAKTAVGWMSTKPGFTRVSGLQIQTDEQSINKLAFPRSQKALRI